MLILGNKLDKHIAPPLLEIDVCNLGNILGGAAATRTNYYSCFLVMRARMTQIQENIRSFRVGEV